MKINKDKVEAIVANTAAFIVGAGVLLFIVLMLREHRDDIREYHTNKVGCGFLFQKKVHDSTTDFELNRAKAELDICLADAKTVYDSK